MYIEEKNIYVNESKVLLPSFWFNALDETKFSYTLHTIYKVRVCLPRYLQLMYHYSLYLSVVEGQIQWPKRSNFDIFEFLWWLKLLPPLLQPYIQHQYI